jgi:hypothetical protein
MRFDIEITIQVDPDANFLETFGDNTSVISEIIQSYLYDLDDITVENCEVTNAK